jgi:predicted SprT family Zn-dependent metalloprotease
MSHDEFRCNVCDATFDTEAELEKHTRTMHAQYICGICGRTLHSQHELEIHNRIMHPEETPVR